ncbi:hypothetical protein SESBI_08144 [Sesbania bispinosa]|nr:hypothetical protein SESBI_08144 [Sesbania bispinosa]
MCAKMKECGNGKMIMKKNLDPEGSSITINFLKSQCILDLRKSLKRKREEHDNTSNVVNVNDVILDQPVIGLPMALQDKIQQMEGREVRFSIPIQQIQHDARDFLTERGELYLTVREGEGKIQKLVGFLVSVLDPSLKLYNMCFKKWKMEHTEVHNITSGWNNLVRNNSLKANDTVQLWFFRSNNNHMCFALVKI